LSVEDEILEEYWRLANPRDHEATKKILAQISSKINSPSAEALKAARHRRWIKRLKDYDSSILAAAGITLDDFVSLIIAHKSRRSGGSQSRRTKKWVAMRKKTLLAIRDADLRGCTWKETIDAALGACSHIALPIKIPA
jgi:hypothetical protein